MNEHRDLSEEGMGGERNRNEADGVGSIFQAESIASPEMAEGRVWEGWPAV